MTKINVLAFVGMYMYINTCLVHLSPFFSPESNCGDPPALIQELSHPTMSFPELQGEKILSISCSEFLSSVLTQSGKVFWW